MICMSGSEAPGHDCWMELMREIDEAAERVGQGWARWAKEKVGVSARASRRVKHGPATLAASNSDAESGLCASIGQKKLMRNIEET